MARNYQVISGNDDQLHDQAMHDITTEPVSTVYNAQYISLMSLGISCTNSTCIR